MGILEGEVVSSYPRGLTSADENEVTPAVARIARTEECAALPRTFDDERWLLTVANHHAMLVSVNSNRPRVIEPTSMWKQCAKILRANKGG